MSLLITIIVVLVSFMFVALLLGFALPIFFNLVDWWSDVVDSWFKGY